ncbi:hypothetical protein L1987_77381 [Smallanthus sonchifolius]|uniref:Uncharacterized protein n=1 Tax=Smallanthus sonchifolius TaxID=185202 RepID=A0ACB8Z9K9_9ASTR|nr:hypothetical protein L1987_77381 [Smallanthus sonchifolius]
MDESKPDRSSDKGPEAPNACKKGKEETETLVHNEKYRPLRIRETHGLRDDIDVDTPKRDVKGPKVFERVKEEFEAIVEAIHQRKEDKSHDSPSSIKRDDAIFKETKKKNSHAEHRGSPSYRGETHGRGEDIDPDTPIGEFKGQEKPSFEKKIKNKLKIRKEKQSKEIILLDSASDLPACW